MDVDLDEGMSRQERQFTPWSVFSFTRCQPVGRSLSPLLISKGVPNGCLYSQVQPNIIG